MKVVVVFIPGYATSATAGSTGDNYVSIERHVRECGADFEYVPLPNNNYGDIGNTTIDECVDHAVEQYNRICSKSSKDDTIILAGHSMGGLIVTRIISALRIELLARRPDRVWLIKPALNTNLTLIARVAATLLSYLTFTTIFRSCPCRCRSRNGGRYIQSHHKSHPLSNRCSFCPCYKRSAYSILITASGT